MNGHFIPLVGSSINRLNLKKVVSIYFQAAPKEEDKKQFAEKTIFIFPGNRSHHPPNVPVSLTNQLKKVKGGFGLGHLSSELGSANYLTLSLPTTGMESYNPKINDDVKKTVEGAISTIWQAINAGYNIALPVRSYKSVKVPEHLKTSVTNKYFDEPLFEHNDQKYEPNFWGENQLAPNPELAKLYTLELKKILGQLKFSMPQSSSSNFSSPSNNSSTMFKRPSSKQHPDEEQLIGAKDKLAQSMREKSGALKDQDFILAKGNIKDTFKVGFQNAAAANSFYEYLDELGQAYNITYYGDAELYPMDMQGKVGAGGNYKYIVRFEISKEALEYLSSINVEDCELLYGIVMGTAHSNILTATM